MPVVGPRIHEAPLATQACAGALRLGLAVADAAATGGPSARDRRAAMITLVMRRHLCLSMLSSAVLAGCGFQLRQNPPLPMRSIALVGFKPESPLGATLKSELVRAGVALRDNPAQAEVVFDTLGDAREKAVAASTAAGQVREVTLRVRLRFRVATPDGKLLLAPTDLLLTREMSFNETAALAKQQEELTLYRAMEDDIVAQVLRRLASVKLT